MGWVNLAMAKVLSVMLGWTELTAVLVSLALTGIYAAMAGLWGVVVTDFLQFTFAMGGHDRAGLVRGPRAGGRRPRRAGAEDSRRPRWPSSPTCRPRGDRPRPRRCLPARFLTYLGVQWWASWYPGQEPGGGGYVAQRMMSARSERDALAATLWFTSPTTACGRGRGSWSGWRRWCSTPTPPTRKPAYVLAMRDHLGSGWRGLLLGAFFAAYMSTISTQLNWGTSYLVNDVYQRFLRPDASEAHYVWASRVTTLLLMALSAVVTFYLESIRQAWEFVLESGAGIGLVLMLRWYWWRVNAWSEVSALVAAAVGFALVRLVTDWVFPLSLVAVVAWTTVWWLAGDLADAAGSGSHARRVLHAGPPAGTGLGTDRARGSAARRSRWRRWSAPGSPARRSSTRCCSASATSCCTPPPRPCPTRSRRSLVVSAACWRGGTLLARL